MEIYTDSKTRLAEEISMEVFIRTLSLKVAREEATDWRHIDDAIADLTDARDDFLLSLANAISEKEIATLHARVEAQIKSAGIIIDSLPKRSEEGEFWNTMDYWMDRSAFDPDHFCAHVDDDLDFLPF